MRLLLLYSSATAWLKEINKASLLYCQLLIILVNQHMHYVPINNPILLCVFKLS